MRQGWPALPATLEQQAGSARGVEMKVDVGLVLFYFLGSWWCSFGLRLTYDSHSFAHLHVVVVALERQASEVFGSSSLSAGAASAVCCGFMALAMKWATGYFYVYVYVSHLHPRFPISILSLGTAHC
eukprot:scaffold13699_cov157-Isochrysis_galbana.AAC.1